MNTKKLLIIFCIIANQFINSAKAQAPQSFNYQAVARDASGAVISNKAVSFRISLLQGSATGASAYTETHAVTTNLLGLVNFAIGGGTVVSGNFATINWAQGPFFAQVELDAANNGTYVVMSTTQLLSVPYANFSNKAENLDNPAMKFVGVYDNTYDTTAATAMNLGYVYISYLDFNKVLIKLYFPDAFGYYIDITLHGVISGNIVTIPTHPIMTISGTGTLTGNNLNLTILLGPGAGGTITPYTLDLVKL
jgi:hypothetical protein